MDPSHDSAPVPVRNERARSGLSMDDFDYPLAPQRIAQTPIEPRDAARLLVSLDPGDLRHRHVRDLPSFVGPGDVVVLNDTKVIPARLRLRKSSGAAVEVLLLEALTAELGSAPLVAGRTWKALVRPGRKLPPGTVLAAGEDLFVEIGEAVDGGQRLITLRDPDTGAVLGADAESVVLERHGVMPLPPYITTPLARPDRYQTTYANLPGSAAAPTAGLHLTTAVLEGCRDAGAQVHTVELRVGLDTFRPVSASRPEDHEIHSEAFRVPEATLQACDDAHSRGARVIAVGTTTVRALESAAHARRTVGRTELFIYGDYPFALVDVLLTNFHLPRSSLLLLIDAFSGPRWRGLYATAALEGYRFLSFGDAMLLGRAQRGSPPRGVARQ